VPQRPAARLAREFPTIHGFLRDDQLPGYNETFDLGRFLMRQGRAFEKAVLAELAQRWQLVRITHRPDEARALSAAIATHEAMEAAVPIIAGGVLRDPQLRMFGVVDLLVRSDVLGQLCPRHLSAIHSSSRRSGSRTGGTTAWST